jgi:5'-3' exonuclease
MVLNLIIDGNYILSKLVFTLHKHNLLYGGLHKALESSILNYRKLYPFSKVYLVSDSKEKSWRREIIGYYKSNRKKDSDIDWVFVYQAYEEFKDSIKDKMKVLESARIEGDDWISFLVKKSNDNGESTMIISNDYDIKQMLKYSLDPLYINMMTNEMYNKEKLFLPKNYQLFINKLSKLPNDDIFNLNDNHEFLVLIERLISKYELSEVDSMESLIVKIISGDSSDNISSAWYQVKNGKKRGIGDAGAKTIYNEYKSEFGEVDLNDVDLNENIADLICEKKKLSKSEIPSIVSNIEENFKLIYLDIDNIPKELVNKMNELYNG